MFAEASSSASSVVKHLNQPFFELVCFQMQEDPTGTLEFLEEFLGKWQCADERYYTEGCDHWLVLGDWKDEGETKSTSLKEVNVQSNSLEAQNPSSNGESSAKQANMKLSGQGVVVPFCGGNKFL
ncbi:hypothetical protein LguiA_022678 [Lonicera macranthoides]